MVETLLILAIVSTAFYVAALVIAFIMGFVGRMDTNNPGFALRNAADDVWTIFWWAWFAGFALAHKHQRRYDREYKDIRKDKRLEFAERKLEQ